jgi:hypothetical protein
VALRFLKVTEPGGEGPAVPAARAKVGNGIHIHAWKMAR